MTASSLVGGVGHAASQRPTAGAVTPDRLKLPSGPSSVRGLADEPSVDPFYAQLEYEVPFELPPGYGGLAPHLGLSYSGALGNGPAGIGWTLGQARIQRSTRLGVPSFTDADELEMSGIVSGRLVAIGNGEYRVEGLGHTVRVRKVDGGFQVDDGSGVSYRLGTSDQSRQRGDADPGHVLTWLVEQQTNTQGETIHYTYTRDQNQVYLASVTWGPGGRYTAAFAYEPRTDATTSFRGGFKVVTARRLATVTTSVATSSDPVVRRTYTLGYDPTLSIARLAGIASTGVGGAGAWPALTFRYATPAAPVVQPIPGVGAWRLNGNGVSFADVDGDGAADLVQLSSGGDLWLRNQDGSFAGSPQPLAGNAQPLSAVQFQDLDGDARPELVADTGNGWAVWKFSATAWTQVSSQWPGSVGLGLKSPTTTRFADLNGDGLVDAMTWNNDRLFVHFGTRAGFGPATAVARIAGSQAPSPTTGRFQDANGDGLDDYLNIAPDHLDLYLGHGDGTFEAAARIAYPPTVGTISNVNDVELADLDRDGMIDLIKINSNNVIWYRGAAAGGFAATGTQVASPEALTSNVVVAIADTNGNGSHDVVWSSANNMWRLDIAGATTAGMLTEVQNGLGLDTTFSYASAHALEIAAEAAGNGWSSTVPIAMPVPIERKTALGPGETTRLIDYTVRDGVWDASEGRFAGFAGTTVTTAGASPAETSIVTTVYANGLGTDPSQPNLQRELRGKPLVVQVFNGAGHRLSATTNTWSTMVVSGLADTPLLRRPILQESQVIFDDTTPKRNTDVVYTYDAFGRAAHVVDHGRTDVTGDESVTDTTYADDDTIWVRDRVCEVKVSDTQGHVVSDTQTLFGDARTIHPLCTVGAGWVRVTQGLLASENRFVAQTATSYDDHGNPVAITKGGVTRQLVYDASDFFVVEEHLTTPSGGDLAWRATWDPVLAVTTSITDPNGHTAQLSYDSLGRYTGRALDGHAPHEVVEYDWTPPFPRTAVWTFDGALANVTAKPATWSATSGWRRRVEVANGKGELRYRATQLADAQWIISDYEERDANSRVVFHGQPVYATTLEQVARPTGIAGDTLTYDPLGRLIEEDLPTGARQVFSYLAFERTIQQGDLAPVHSVLDGQGRAILTERSLADGTHEIVQASYDPAGRLTQMTVAGGSVVRSFSYDTLGRVVQSQDPDLGSRVLTWDDGDRLLSERNAAGQVITYSYDSLGRLSTRDTGALYRYHYDTAAPGATGPAANLAGQLAWVEEPTGTLEVSYDELGRTSFTRRTIDHQVSELTTAYTASGLVASRGFDDGFSYSYRYDPAGRPIGAGDLWTLLDQDASGLPLHEQARNGVDTRYTRDLLGLPSEVAIHDVAGRAIYDVTAARNASLFITQQTDRDGFGLDHSATFSYDGFSRLTGATIGAGAQAFTFAYAYDALHNMTARTAHGPRSLSAMFGTYHYGEHGRAARQLTSITDDDGGVTHTFDYDAAGRQVAEDGLHITFDASDRVTAVTGLANGGAVSHAYGNDGNRVKTVAPDGSVSYFFGDGTAIHNGIREHDVAVGNRVVARVATPLTTGDAGVAAGWITSVAGRAIGLLALAFALGCALLGKARALGRRVRAVAMLGLTLATACSSPGLGVHRQTLASDAQATFLHTGFGAGPSVFTDASGHLLEERRYEPFGAAIDAHTVTAGGEITGAPDVVARDLNERNQRTDAATGWSDHGARWQAPETGRWLSPDPPVSAPSAKFMAEPWTLHPYQYVDQNPVAYWDPDGREAAIAEGAAGATVATSPSWWSRVAPWVAAAAEIDLLPVAIVAGLLFEPSDQGSAVRNGSQAQTQSQAHAQARAEAKTETSEAARPTLTFYRGTTWYDAAEVVQNQRFDPARISRVQSGVSHAPGLYLTSQLSSGFYYANLAGGNEGGRGLTAGRGGGPGLLVITVDAESFADLAVAFGIPVETPVPQPPTPGQTETYIPPQAIEAFNSTIVNIGILP
ncbi:MAG TPA: FG-GAP-like repeat-containing protein [Kofleriaceae bacterium]|nr:FG-GAP-like repeat-containing protein [Kofleriaceae bacterium]